MEKQENDSKNDGKDVGQNNDLSSSNPYLLSIGPHLSTYPPIEHSKNRKEIKESGVDFDL